MPTTLAEPLNPRKQPIQARSTLSVECLLDAAIQLLLAVGKDRLTTTLVAVRAGVSVGTLYQYFPNKNALLQAALSRHLLHVADTIEATCAKHHHKPAAEMVTALISNFFAAKMQSIPTSIALYQISSTLDGARIVRQTGARSHKAIALMLATAPEPVSDAALAATIVQGALAGISRRILESPSPEEQLPAIQEQTITLLTAYLATISATDLPARALQSS